MDPKNDKNKLADVKMDPQMDVFPETQKKTAKPENLNPNQPAPVNINPPSLKTPPETFKDDKDPLPSETLPQTPLQPSSLPTPSVPLQTINTPPVVKDTPIVTKVTSPAPTDGSQTKPADATLKGGMVTGKKSNYNLFIGILVIITLAILGGVGYLYFRNQQLKNGSDPEVVANPTVVNETPSFSPDQIQIVEGSILRVLPFGESTVLVDKVDYPSTGIAGFAKVIVSPDNQKLCFESYPPALGPALYVSNSDGSDVVSVASNSKDCAFTGDSEMIVYADFADYKTPSDIYLYNLVTKDNINLSSDQSDGGVSLHYELRGFSEDGLKVLCSTYKTNININSQEPVLCEIPLTTGGAQDEPNPEE